MATKAEIAKAVRMFQEELDASAPALAEIINAPTGAERSSTMATTTTPTAETLAEGIGDVFSPPKAPYSRILANGRTLAYASPRKDGVMLDFATSAVEGWPKRFQKSVEMKNGLAHLRVTGRNAKTARALLEWLARQV